MGVTTITSNLDVPTVGQPTKNTLDTYSLVDTTEKTVDVHMVDESLLTSQRIIDSRLTSIDPWDAVAPQRDKTRIEDELCQWSDLNLQAIGLGFEADEEISCDTSVKKWFDKMEFLNEFHKAVNDMITHMIKKVAEEPHGYRHSKWLCEKKAMPPPPKTNDMNSVARWNSIDSHQTQETDNFICHFVRPDFGSTDHVWQKIRSATDHWAEVEKDAA